MQEWKNHPVRLQQAVRVAGRTTEGAKGKGITEDVLEAWEAAQARHNRLQQGDFPP